MEKITRLSIANIKKHRKESLLLCLLIIFCTALLASSIASIFGIRKIFPNMVQKSECFKSFSQISQDVYTDRFLLFLEEDTRVEKYANTGMVSGMLKVKNFRGTGEEKEYDLNFVPMSGEKLLEKFEPEGIAQAKHPIYLDRSNQKALNLSEGDTLTILYKDREFTFTVAGFYQSGLWIYGTKAVVSEEDFAELEEYLERYEVIGINTAFGTDDNAFLKEFELFCRDISVNDLASAVSLYAYKDTVMSGTANMALLSIVIAVMAGVIVIAVMVMIRFRIVSDIQDQIVSIGVLEALGYRSGEISLSYIVEYLLIAGAGTLLGALPAVALTGFLLDHAASTIHYSGNNVIPFAVIVFSILGILLFVGLIAMSKALSVRNYPPVLAFRKGIRTHHFKKSFFPLDKTRRNIQVRLALKGFFEHAGQNIGLIVCIMASAVMVLLSFLIGSFFGSPDRILNSVSGHELCDIRLETVGGIEAEAFQKELEALPEVKKVLLCAAAKGARLTDSDSALSLEIYKDYSETENILLTEGRFPQHENELMVTSQLKKMKGLHVGDTVSLEYAKVKRDYLITGVVNSVINPNTAYLTDVGFKRMHPAYIPNAFDIYFANGVERNSFADSLSERYGKNIVDISKKEVTGETMEERIRSAAEIRMEKAMLEKGVSYMEYAIRIGDRLITGSTSTMKISSMTYVREEYREMIEDLSSSFFAVSCILMFAAAIVVMIILSILMSSTIRRNYRELGIMKGMGYTSKELMFQMAFQIVPSALIAVAVGTACSILLLGFAEMFIAKITVSPLGVAVTDFLILFYCFGCAYLGARKIRRISVYELMTE